MDRTPARVLNRFRGLVVVAVAALLAGAAGPAAAAAPHTAMTTSQTAAMARFVPLRPARLLDTRAGIGAPKAVPSAGSTLTLTVTGRGGVPSSGVSAVVLNVTAVSPARAGYVTLYPTGTTRPVASNLNYVAGVTIANQAVARVGSGGTVRLYTASSTNLVADVVGYYPSGAAFTALRPARLVDSRYGLGAAKAPRPAGSILPVKVTGRAGVPSSGVGTVVLNVTAVQAAAPGWLTVYPAGATRPHASNVNYATGQTVAGLVFAKVGTNRTVYVYSSAKTHLLVDVVGWVPTTSDFIARTPTRLADTRTGLGVAKARVPAGGSVTVQITGRGGVPPIQVSAAELNVTMVKPATAGWLTVHPAGTTRPQASTVNSPAGAVVANSVTAKLSPGGKVTVYASAGTDIVVDVTGWFVNPAAILPAVPESSTTAAQLTTLLKRTGTVTPMTPIVRGCEVVGVRGAVPATGDADIVVYSALCDGADIISTWYRIRSWKVTETGWCAVDAGVGDIAGLNRFQAPYKGRAASYFDFVPSGGSWILLPVPR